MIQLRENIIYINIDQLMFIMSYCRSCNFGLHFVTFQKHQHWLRPRLARPRPRPWLTRPTPRPLLSSLRPSQGQGLTSLLVCESLLTDIVITFFSHWSQSVFFFIFIFLIIHFSYIFRIFLVCLHRLTRSKASTSSSVHIAPTNMSSFHVSRETVVTYYAAVTAYHKMF